MAMTIDGTWEPGGRSVKRLCGWLAAAGLAFVLAVIAPAGSAQAQDQTQPPADAAAAPGGEPDAPWSARCIAPHRDAPLNCQIEQRAVVTETGQLLLLVTIAVPGESRQPVLTIRAPLQLFLPAGVRVDIDGRNAEKLEFRTCDQQGCYVRTPISNATLDAMFRGLKLNIILENLNNQQLTVPMSLSGFTEVYNKVR